MWPMCAAISFQITVLYKLYYLVFFLSRLQSSPKQNSTQEISASLHAYVWNTTQNTIIINKTDYKINQTD